MPKSSVANKITAEIVIRVRRSTCRLFIRVGAIYQGRAWVVILLVASLRYARLLRLKVAAKKRAGHFHALHRSSVDPRVECGGGGSQ